MPTHIDMKAVLCIAVLPGVLGCAAMKDFGQSLDGGGTEQVKGVYHVEKVSKDKFKGVPPSYIRTTRTRTFNVYRLPWEDRSIGHAVAMAYYYCLDSPRFIRYIRLITADSIKNINIYVWEGENWTMVRQLKTPVDAQTRIDINRRSNGIRVVQKTMKAQQRDHVTDF